MAQLPPEPQHGVPLSATWGRQLIRYLRSITPRSSPTVRVLGGAGGIQFVGARQSSRITVAHPFRIEIASGSTVTVAPGSVNGLQPTIGGVSIAAIPAPELSVAATGIVHLVVTVDEADDLTGEPTIAHAAALPADTYVPGEGGLCHLALASVTVTSGTITQVASLVTHSLLLTLGDRAWWQSA